MEGANQWAANQDDRQMKALTAYPTPNSTTCCRLQRHLPDHASSKCMNKGVSGTRTRTPGGGSKGKLPTMADKRLFVLYTTRHIRP